AEGAAIARELGVRRVVLPRELSIEEIRTLAAGTDLELEWFVHGGLCVSWSGQCLNSEALQHRSANRGQCAQTGRLPYELVVDGTVATARRRRPASPADGPERNAEASIDEQLKYLLSPRDLAAHDLLPQLIDAGVSCFKIEGRMKGPEYVANVVEKYRRGPGAGGGGGARPRPPPAAGRICATIPRRVPPRC